MPASRIFNLATAETVTGTVVEYGAWIPTTDFRNGDSTNNQAYSVAMAALQLVSITGTAPTLDVSIQGSMTGASTGSTLDAFSVRTTAGPSGTAAAFASITVAGSDSFQLLAPLPPYVRYRAILGGTTPTCSFNLQMQAISVGNCP
jgi:hypothetical protein